MMCQVLTESSEELPYILSMGQAKGTLQLQPSLTQTSLLIWLGDEAQTMTHPPILPT